MHQTIYFQINSSYHTAILHKLLICLLLLIATFAHAQEADTLPTIHGIYGKSHPALE